MGCDGCNELAVGAQGYNGWSPVFETVIDNVNLDDDDNPRVVLQLTGWTGGEGITPTIHVNEYLTTSGYTSDISLATNIKGPQGDQGIQGIQGLPGASSNNETDFTGDGLPSGGCNPGTFGQTYSDTNPLSPTYQTVWQCDGANWNMVGTLEGWITYTPTYGVDIVMFENGSSAFSGFQLNEGKIKYKKSGKTVHYHFNFVIGFAYDGGSPKNFDYILGLRLPIVLSTRLKLKDRNNSGNYIANFIFDGTLTSSIKDFSGTNVTSATFVIPPVTAPTEDEWFATGNLAGTILTGASTNVTNTVLFRGNYVFEVE